MKLVFEKKEKRDQSLTVRLPKSTVDKLKAIADKHNQSQAEVLKTLIEMAHKGLSLK